MTNYMRKTKKELVAVIRDLESETRHLQAAAEENRSVEDPRIQDLERYQRENERLLTEAEQLRREHDRIKAELGQLRDEAQAAQADKQRLAHELADLREELAETEKRLKQKADDYSTGYELFKSFVDQGDRVIVLVDASYTIRYVNQAAAAHFLLPSPYAIVGRRIFDFFSYKDASRLKEKIDGAFLKGVVEKIKDLQFQNLKGTFFKIRIRLARVRYEDRPCIKMEIR
jgi:PAS domain-containing protein